jgi:hypothetical protein
MGVGIQQFNPEGIMTRAEFGTVLSRTLRWATYNQEGDNYYKQHLQQLQNIWIMNDISQPYAQELRGWVMLMLMRTGGSIGLE